MPQAGRLRILVVNGEPAILRLLRASLKGQGYIVSTATDARTAIDLLHRDTTDLVVLDLGLIDGLNVIRQIRNGGGTLPIIVLSSCDSVSSKVSAIDLGADNYVTKPFGINELLARIRTAQRHRLAQGGRKIFVPRWRSLRRSRQAGGVRPQ
jgi:two-component system KDP operon response regulator KdpE